MSTGATEKHELQSAIEAVHHRFRHNTHGQVATYIPELGKANPEDFGIAWSSTSGAVFETGDCDHPFTIQSISKPFTFGMALESVWPDESVRTCRRRAERRCFQRHRTAERDESAVQSDDQLGRHHGDGAAPCEIWRRDVRSHPRSLQHRRRPDPARWIQAVFESERRTGHRNRAIAHLLLNFGMVHDAAEAALDVYFRQCSILVTSRDLAVMGATLANMGSQSDHAADGVRPGNGPQHDGDHVHVRDVRLFRRMGVSRRCSRQERCRRRRARGRQPPTRNRHLLATSRCARQQPSRHRSLCRIGIPVRPPRVRLPEHGLEFPRPPDLTLPSHWQHSGPQHVLAAGAASGLRARTKALANLPSTCGARRSTSIPASVRNARASSIL